MYPLKFREKVLKVKEKDNLSFEQVGKRFDVHPRTIQRWAVRIMPITKRNKPAVKINMEMLSKDVKENPDSYQFERAKKFGVSAWGIGVALRRLKISNKKNSDSSKSGQNKKNKIPDKN